MSSEITEMEIEETSTAQEASVPRPDLGKRRAHDSIFRAPAHMRYDREKDFEPKLVSIGPYYHGQPKFEQMEILKRQCVPYLLQKRPVVDQRQFFVDQRQFVQEFMKFEREARLFYKEKFDQRGADFVGMLVNDSCFVIRVILSLSQEVQESMAFLDVNIKEVRSDLLLLENQIPLFFIKEVYTRLFPTDQIFPPFVTVLEPFIGLDMPWRINRDGMSSKAAHLLDLYWRCSTSETLNSFGSCLEKVINKPINNFLQAIKEPLESENMKKALHIWESDFLLVMEQGIIIIFELLGFHKQEVKEQLDYTYQFRFQRRINNLLEEIFFYGFTIAVREQLDTFQGEELSDFQGGLEQVVIEQLITFRSDFQKVIDEQRPLIRKEVDDSLIRKEVDDFGRCGGPLARMVPLNYFRSCFEQGQNEQLNNIQSDVEQEMNERLNYLSIGLNQVINKQLDYLGRPGFLGEQPSLVEIYWPTKVIANATVLHQKAGINFGKLNHEHYRDGLDVIFSNGIMQMPFLKIDSCQKTLLVNLIAYENSKLPSMRTFSSYIKLMDALIDSEKDVELLQQCGVISNTLSSHQMAAIFFNDIGNFCLIDHKSNCFLSLYENVLKYYDSSWNRTRASLRQNYCSNPWAKISVCAGVTLLLLTVVQTIFTVCAYIKQPK